MQPFGPGRVVATVGGGYAVLGGTLTLVGWWLDVPRLMAWGPTAISMKVNAALCVSVIGAALLLTVLVPDRRLVARALALCAATMGGLTLVQHLTGLDFGIDTLLVDEAPGAPATAAPGRMGPPASTSFLLLGLALAGFHRRRGRAVAAALAVVVLGVMALSLVGYLYGASQLYAFSRLTGIALQTGTMIAGVAIGILAVTPDFGIGAALARRDPGGEVLRRLWLPVLLVPLLLGATAALGVREGLLDAPLALAALALTMSAALFGLVWSAARDISSHAAAARDAARALASSEELLRRALRAGRMYAWTLDLRTRRIVRSENTGEVAGLPPDATLDEFRGVFDPEDHQRMVAATERAVAAGGEFAAEGRLRRPDTDEVVWLQTRGRVERDEEGRPSRIDGIAIDVSERKRAEEALREADRRKDEFLATLAHELRNPLAPLRNALHVMRLTEDPRKREDARTLAERQVAHMVRLIDDLMDLSRMTQGRLQVRKEKTSLDAVIASALETARPVIEKAGHELTCVLPPRAVRLEADRTRLAQVFSNLLANAAKYTDRGGHLSLAATCTDGEVAVSVKDDGIGLAPGETARVFDMFWQAEQGGDRVQGGMGIGLALVKALVELHGGTVEARSDGKGRGSEFVVRLPVSAEAAQDGLASAARDAAAGGDGAGLRVLIVDDNRDSAESLAAVVGLLGSEVRTASDGVEGVEAAASFRPDLILMDIGMPRLNGVEATRRIRQQAWGTRPLIYALTGWGQDADRQRSREAGCDGHFVKPVDIPVLQRLVEDLAAGRRGPAAADPPPAGSR